jgi:hypothetical protein
MVAASGCGRQIISESMTETPQVQQAR